MKQKPHMVHDGHEGGHGRGEYAEIRTSESRRPAAAMTPTCQSRERQRAPVPGEAFKSIEFFLGHRQEVQGGTPFQNIFSNRERRL